MLPESLHVQRRETFDIYLLFVNTEVARETTVGLGYLVPTSS